MKKFFRLLRYGLPYSLQWVPGVMLLAAVGVLDTFDGVVRADSSSVLKPDAPNEASSFFLLRRQAGTSICTTLFLLGCTCTMREQSWPSLWSAPP